jgi:predicted DNA-binding transcriptional regulator AlpA
MMIDRIRTRAEFAQLLAISVRTLDRLVKRGELPDPDDLRALVENEINALIDRPRCRLNFSGVALGPSLAKLQAAAAPVWVATDDRDLRR